MDMTREDGLVGQTGMGGSVTGASGGPAGTNGARFWPVFAVIAAFTLVIIAVNITSTLIETPPSMHHYRLWEPFTWELSSAASLLLLCPVLFRLYQRFPLRRVNVGIFAIHLGLMLGWSVCHVAIMVVIRKIVYAVMGLSYDFSHGHLPLIMLYEGRKDFVSYALYTGVFWVSGRLANPAAPAVTIEAPQRLEIKAGSRTLYVVPSEITWIEAAGNYVELYLADRPQPVLVRGTLGEYESRLAAEGFVRVHRSRLLNRNHVQGFEVTRSGDIAITLNDGRDLTGSRRYRANLG